MYSVKKIGLFLKFCINSGGTNVGTGILRDSNGRAHIRENFYLVLDGAVMQFI